MSDSSGSTGNVLLAFTLGALAGAAAAILFAPASGEDTRKRIRDFTGDVVDKAGDYVSGVKKRVNEGISRGKEAIGERKGMIKSAIEAGKEAYAKEKERVERGDEA